MADVRIEIDERKLKKVAFESDACYQLVLKKRDQTEANANAYSAGFTTREVIDFKTHKKVGGQQPKYRGSTRRFRTSDGVSIPVGIVYTANYAAMKDNHDHNTLLKAM